MTAAGWHPDPHGRAARRYHDGTAWTAHVSDDAGATSLDPLGAAAVPPVTGPVPVAESPPPGLVIGPPPPRQAHRPSDPPTPADGRDDPSDGATASPVTADPSASSAGASEAAADPSASSAGASEVAAGPSVSSAGASEVVADPSASSAGASEVAGSATTADRAPTAAVPSTGPSTAAASAPSSEATGPAATADIAPDDDDDGGVTGPIDPAALEPESTSVVAGGAPGPTARPADATQVTRIPAELLDLAVPGAVATPPGGSVAAAPSPSVALRAGTSPAGLALAVVGVVLGLVSLFALPWAEGGGAEASFSDLRRVVVGAGPDIGAAPTSLLLAGAVFALAVGGVVALARALGLAVGRVVAAVVVVVGCVVLSVVAFSSADLDTGDDTTAPTTQPGVPGDTIVDEDTGAAVTDPDSGALVTVPQVDPADALDRSGPAAAARDRLGTGAMVAAGLMALSGALCVAGLLLRRTSGHVLAAAGLGVNVLWAGVGSGVLATDDQIADLGAGALAFVVATIVLAVAAALPASTPRG